MIKISKAAVILGLTDDEKGKSTARVVLNYFSVKTTEEALPEGKFGKPSKLYDEAQVRKIADFVDTFV